jgi:hypothetical protein
MNKRLTLFFRGQAQDWDPVPALFRDSWSCFGVSERVRLRDRAGFWKELPQIGQRVYEICRESELGLPRWRGLRDIRETQWSVIQHYGVWPIPLITSRAPSGLLLRRDGLCRRRRQRSPTRVPLRGRDAELDRLDQVRYRSASLPRAPPERVSTGGKTSSPPRRVSRRDVSDLLHER